MSGFPKAQYRSLLEIIIQYHASETNRRLMKLIEGWGYEKNLNFQLCWRRLMKLIEGWCSKKNPNLWLHWRKLWKLIEWWCSEKNHKFRLHWWKLRKLIEVWCSEKIPSSGFIDESWGNWSKADVPKEIIQFSASLTKADETDRWGYEKNLNFGQLCWRWLMNLIKGRCSKKTIFGFTDEG